LKIYIPTTKCMKNIKLENKLAKRKKENAKKNDCIDPVK
jgi:hypothetical protein